MKKYFLSFLLTLMLFGCSAQANLAEKDGFYMGTVVTTKVFGRLGKEAIREALARIEEIENKMAFNLRASEIYRLNALAGSGETVDLSPETLFVLKAAKEYFTLSEGAFDILIGPLISKWGFLKGTEKIPSEKEIEEGLALLGYHDLDLDLHAGTGLLKRSGQMVDLGGIAKGYAGDEVIRIYKSKKIKSAYVNLGGNVVVLGAKPDGSPWRIALRDPRANDGSYLGFLDLKDRAVVTSGDYERCFFVDGDRYHHILDPQTGYPARSGLISATIVADSSLAADALSTACFVLGLEQGMALLSQLPSIEGVFVTEDQKIYLSLGLEGFFTLIAEGKGYQIYEEK